MKRVETNMEGMINEIIKDEGLEKKEVAERMSKSPQSFNNIIKNGSISTVTLISFFKALGCKLTFKYKEKIFEIDE